MPGNMCIDLETPDRLSRKGHASCALALLAGRSVELKDFGEEVCRCEESAPYVQG